VDEAPPILKWKIRFRIPGAPLVRSRLAYVNKLPYTPTELILPFSSPQSGEFWQIHAFTAGIKALGGAFTIEHTDRMAKLDPWRNITLR